MGDFNCNSFDEAMYHNVRESCSIIKYGMESQSIAVSFECSPQYLNFNWLLSNIYTWFIQASLFVPINLITLLFTCRLIFVFILQTKLYEYIPYKDVTK